MTIATKTSGHSEELLDAVDRIRRIDHLVVSWRGQVSSASSRLPERAIELLLENPFWTVSALAERLGVAFTTAQRAIDRLESVGIVARTSAAKRNRLYCARAVLEILEEPARPVAEEGLRTGRPR